MPASTSAAPPPQASRCGLRSTRRDCTSSTPRRARASREPRAPPPRFPLASGFLRHGRRARRRELLAELRAADELPAARLREQLVALDDHLAAAQHDLRRAAHLRAVED